ncbi:hypothetical protein Q4567_17125 [Aliiglaciecola sp. 2_MG-2023]|uniref:DUF6776 family protein n=1 Tax=unclassified Aliiglaciecola TaxID=2593648 RepID=UPI0026E40BA4|nr:MULTISPECIES: DUF6776 family protein [unclassified Aliiglaciecola]MDO6712460.1 hypothetical protein [Aliiglaciecola sp. 2_MG-2023]MDO6753482.1 hypothetical protein [Aliiglaciecola sp. 1_MG-2023]
MIPDEIRKTWSAFKFYTVLLILFICTAYFAFMYGNSHFESQNAKISTLEHTIENLSLDNQRLTKQLNILGVELEVQRLAVKKSQQMLEQGLANEAKLKEEIQFYQRVMAPELEQDGFVIEAFEIKKSLSDRAYWFELVLMQQDKIKNVVKGSIEVSIIGSEAGKPKQYNLSELVTQESSELSFSFKYFQTIQGEMILPENFSPEKILVKTKIFQFKRKRGELERTFDWNIETLQTSTE